MKNLSFLTLILFLYISCAPTTTLFIVRHAEKIDNSIDPELSVVGKERAARLTNMLLHEHIKAIYSTNFKRTIQTATPLSELKKIPISFYATDTLPHFAAFIKKQKANVLIVGHSNSTITLLDALGLSHKIKTIDDSDYSNLFKVTLRGKASKMKLEESKF